MNSWKTPKGTELQLRDIKGKQYLEVKWRIVWFREERPAWTIDTDLLTVTQTSALAKATVRDENGRIIVTSHKFEDKQGFPDFIEKAETGAIGRALALIGYGTQFCADEFDEGNRLADSPAERPVIVNHALKISEPKPNVIPQEEAVEDFGDVVCNFGRKFKDKKIKNINPEHLKGYISWIKAQNAKSDKPPASDVLNFIWASENYLKTLEGSAS
jgi:hypothetical protein